MRNHFTESYDLLVKELTEIDQLLFMSVHDQFEQQYFILRSRQKREWDDLQDKWIFEGGKQRANC